MLPAVPYEAAPLLLALDQVPALVAVLRGPDLVYEFVNAAYAAVVPIAAPIGKPFGSSEHERSSQMREIVRRVYDKGEPLSFRESQLSPGLDGREERFFDIRVVPLRDAAGKVDGVMIHSLDVTDLVRERDRTRRNEAQLRSLANANLIGIGFFSNGNLADANDELLRMLGYDRADLAAGRIVWSELTPPEHAPATAAALQELRSRGAYAPFEKEYFRKDGTRVPVLIGGASLELSAREGCAFVLDLTERKRTEQLQERLLHLQKLDSLGLLAGGLAHDFNNLLTIILGSVSAASRILSREHAAARMLDAAQTAIDHATRLTRQLLAYSGKGRLRVEVTDASAMVRDIAEMLRASVPKSVELVLDLPGNLPAIEVDVAQFQQVVMNLIVNGAEAITGAGRLVVATRAEHVDAARVAASAVQGETVAPGRYVVVEVRDTGCGMDAATMRRVFDPFFTTKFTGRGLGLGSVLGIVRGHRGTIELESKPGAGTTFRVLFPVSSRVPAHVVAEPATAPAVEGVILVVDDDALVRSTTARLLETLGFQVVEADSGERALEIVSARSSEIAAVTLDVTMPGMSGEETMRGLRALRGDLPVVVASGYGESTATGWWASLPNVAFLAKPYRIEEMMDRLRAVTTSARASRAR